MISKGEVRKLVQDHRWTVCYIAVVVTLLLIIQITEALGS